MQMLYILFVYHKKFVGLYLEQTSRDHQADRKNVHSFLWLRVTRIRILSFTRRLILQLKKVLNFSNESCCRIVFVFLILFYLVHKCEIKHGERKQKH